MSGNAGKDNGPLVDAALGSATSMHHLILGEGQNAFVANGKIIAWSHISKLMLMQNAQALVERH